MKNTKLGKFFTAIVLAAVATASAPAFAVIDIANVLLGITDAGTAILAVIGALLTLSVSLFGIVKVYRFVSGKAGA